MLSDAPVDQKIELFVREYSRVLMNNPFLPSFILGEVNRNPELILGFFKRSFGLLKAKSIPALQATTKMMAEEGKIRPIDHKDLILNMIGMILFPIISKPILVELLFDGDENAFNTFLGHREKHITDFINHSLNIQK
jgi:TetR/AcrR family transcriptional regulator